MSSVLLAPLASQRTLGSIAAVGAVAWALYGIVADHAPSGDDPVSWALALAVACIVPLGLSVVPALPAERGYFTVLSYLMPPAQLGGLAALLLPTGPVAGGAASLWVVVCTLVAIMGMGRMRVATTLGERGIAMAWLYLPVGAVWLVMARAGAAPLGLSALLVSLTAAHFHYAGYASLVVVSLAWEHSERIWVRRMLGVAIALAAASMVVVALGITLSPQSVDSSMPSAGEGTPVGSHLSRLGAILLTAVFAMHALSMVDVLPRMTSRVAKVLLALGALAPLASLPLAVLYTFGMIYLDTMIAWHAPLNSYGFAGLCCLAWALTRHTRVQA